MGGIVAENANAGQGIRGRNPVAALVEEAARRKDVAAFADILSKDRWLAKYGKFGENENLQLVNFLITLPQTEQLIGMLELAVGFGAHTNIKGESRKSPMETAKSMVRLFSRMAIAQGGKSVPASAEYYARMHAALRGSKSTGAENADAEGAGRSLDTESASPETVKEYLAQPDVLEERKNAVKEIRLMLAKYVLGEKQRREGLLSVHERHFRRWHRILLYRFFGGNVYEAVNASYPEYKIMEWEMKHLSSEFFEPKEKRGRAIRWAAEVSGVDVSDRRSVLGISSSDLSRGCLAEMFSEYYGGNVFLALNDAFPEHRILPWELKEISEFARKNPEIARSATRWLVESELGISARDLNRISKVSEEDFRIHGLGFLVDQTMTGALLRSAYPMLGRKVLQNRHPAKGALRE